ncbi:hypothetical protein BVG16_07020 [Paenibacillus selenitireducens]|uniref:Glycosyl transferase family 1 domain-containing protein n=1 Tax=Paenibacillus selenitireducens TaxID=1324314 RepID=A0A1T2XLD5_9BACL|nr:glycosyltransferase [Paenibacillus selenitireducens]OPA80473.1 hypothetical protein BVG16_07020 [Paenibacillus selenitireducens]
MENYILVNATALDSRGSLTVLRNFLVDIKTNERFLDESHIKLFVLVSVREMEVFNSGCCNIIYRPFPKKSIFHKWYFERYILKSIIKEFNISSYLSLQNIGIKIKDIMQYCLIHQAIPFTKLKKGDIEFKNIIKYSVLYSAMLKNQINYNNTIIVQTNWMRDALLSKYKYVGKIVVLPPVVSNISKTNNSLPPIVEKDLTNNHVKFLYVTNIEKYKNNKRLIDAFQIYNSNNKRKAILYLTIKGESNEFIKCIGKIEHESMFTLYKNVDVLIFPSLTESLGLPLIEAQEAGLDIIAADLPYAHELCPEKTIYFNPYDVQSIITSIESYMSELRAIEQNLNTKGYNGKGYIDYIKLIHEDFLSHNMV